MYNWACGRDMGSENPADQRKVKRPSEPPARNIYLTEEQERAAIAEAAPTIAQLMEWLYETGMRLGEALELRRGEIDRRSGFATVYLGKNDDSRRVPLSDWTLELIKVKAARSDYLFPGPTGERMDANWASKRIVAALKAGWTAGREAGIGPHAETHAHLWPWGLRTSQRSLQPS